MITVGFLVTVGVSCALAGLKERLNGGDVLLMILSSVALGLAASLVYGGGA